MTAQTFPEYTLLLVALSLVLLLAGRPVATAVIRTQEATRVTALVSHRACSDAAMKDCWEIKP
jgi:Flp pilus assembly pilin Flp